MISRWLRMCIIDRQFNNRLLLRVCIAHDIIAIVHFVFLFLFPLMSTVIYAKWYLFWNVSPTL